MNYYNKVIDLPGEIWKPVPIEGFEGYSVSNKGRVKREMVEKFFLKDKSVRLFPEMLIKQRVGKNGYLKVNLYCGDDMLTISVHRLVAMAFIENPNHYSQVNHKDENPLNNCVENLEWVSPKQNANYGTRTERMKQAVTGRKKSPLSEEQKKKISETLRNNNTNCKPVICGNTIFKSAKAAAEYYGVVPSTLRGWINNQTMPDRFKELGLKYKDS